MQKITKRVVDAASPADKRYYVWDSEIKGFGLLVLPTGIKSYIYRYRTSEGRDRRATIAKCGSMTPDQARDIADKHRRLVTDGGDPLEAKLQDRNQMTVAEILDAYLVSAKFADKAESTQAIDRGRVKRHLKPLLGKSFAHKLTAEAVRKALADIRAGKTAVNVKTRQRGRAIVKGGDMAARDSIGLLRSVLNWAKQEGMISDNPAASIKLMASNVRDTILDGPKDYEALFATLATMENERRIRGPVADAIRVIALTGMRKGEVVGLLWQYVDIKARTITLPPLAHKAGRKTGKPRLIALPAAACEIIGRQTAGKPEDFVFRALKGVGPISLNKPWHDVRTEAGLPEGIGLHGLRHSMASMLAMGGAQASEIQAALGHATMAMSAKYVHWADNARATLAERAAGPALAGLAAASGNDGADIIPLKKDA